MRDTPLGGQGEALLAWAVWTLIGLEIVVTYSRVPASELYNVSHGGIAGGLGRVVVYTNYPVSLVAIALVLIAVDVLPRAAWWAAGPAIALCALTSSTVDPGDLDVRWINVFPAVGVLIAIVLTYAAVRRAGTSFVSRAGATRSGSWSRRLSSCSRSPGSRRISASTYRETCSSRSRS